VFVTTAVDRFSVWWKALAVVADGPRLTVNDTRKIHRPAYLEKYRRSGKEWVVQNRQDLPPLGMNIRYKTMYGLFADQTVRCANGMACFQAQPKMLLRGLHSRWTDWYVFKSRVYVLSIARAYASLSQAFTLRPFHGQPFTRVLMLIPELTNPATLRFEHSSH